MNDFKVQLDTFVCLFKQTNKKWPKQQMKQANSPKPKHNLNIYNFLKVSWEERGSTCKLEIFHSTNRPTKMGANAVLSKGLRSLFICCKQRNCYLSLMPAVQSAALILPHIRYCFEIPLFSEARPQDL